MATLFLVRHGQASYGESDYDKLSSRGHEQAQAVGRALASLRLDSIYAGPLRRQQETVFGALAAAAAAGVTLPTPRTLAGLAEYPAFAMLEHFVPRLAALDPTFAALGSAPTPRLLDAAFRTVLERWSDDTWTVDGVERVGEFVARVRGALDGVLRGASSGARIACVTSAGPIGVALGLVFGLPPTRMLKSSTVVRNASITELRFRSSSFDWQPDQLSLVTFNSTGHLPAELSTER